MQIKKITKKHLCVLFTLAGLLVLQSLKSGAVGKYGIKTNGNPPNIVFILADDLGWKELGCYGNDFNETANLDRLASKGKKFTQAYAAAPVCSPTRASIMTGQYPARIGITDFLPEGEKTQRFLNPDSYVTLNEALTEKGYQTGIIGKWHLDTHFSTRKGSPTAHGFHEVTGSETAYIADGDYFYPYGKINTYTSGSANEYLTDRQSSDACDFIKKNNNTPFFLYLSYYGIHTKLEAPKATVDKYKAKFDAKYGAGKANLLFEANERHTANHLDNPYLAAMLEHIDSGVGLVMQTLEDMGLSENTIVVFTSDNGGELDIANNGNLRAYKTWIYEGGIRVPLLFSWPKEIISGEITEPVSSIDFYPTLFSAAGGDAKQYTVDGENLLPLLKNGSGLNNRELYWHYPAETSQYTNRMATAVRKGNYKLLKFHLNNKYELYDLQKDPYEKNNLVAEEQQKVQELSSLMEQWMINVNAEAPNVPVQAIDNSIIKLADPTILYHEGTYYLYGTTGNGSQGFEVYVSTDLKNWNGPAGINDGYALKKGDVFGESGFWAPQVFYYNNKFYMAYTAEENIALAVSDNPLGPFKQQEKKTLFQSGKNIDPFIFMDGGKKYLYYVNTTSANGNRIYVAELEDDLSAIRSGTIQECIRVSSGTWEKRGTASVAEGPTVIRQGSKYFLIYSANAWNDPNYAVGYATSTSPVGPWSKYTGNPIINKQNIGVNGPGHGDVFKDENGNWKYVFHTHSSNNEVSPRKIAVADAGFTNGGQQFTINPSDFYYLKRTIYFKQDFNFSTNYNAYLGKGANQFDGLPFNGNATLNTLNNKLQMVKSGGAGTNRVAAAKTDTPFNPDGVGGFLKFSMEVSVKNNTANVPEGFRFSVGALITGSNAPFSPDPNNIHSDLYINPTSTPGTFILQGGYGTAKIASQPLSGTQKLIWYINNRGSETGYLAPDGSLASVKDDCADVWAISGTTARLVLHNAPATSPTVAGLRVLKITNDPNFVATLEIDDIVIAEEPVLPVLPVSLISFEGEKDGGYIKLSWSTASEQNNSHFELLRSADGKAFENIKTVQGNGTSNKQHFYAYTDKLPLAGTNYYKLKQVDLDGTATVHANIVAVKAIAKSDEFKVIAITDDQIKLSIYTPESTVGDLVISDIQGRKIYKGKLNLDKGYNAVTISDVHFTNGIFIANLVVKGKSSSIKFVKQ